MHMRLDWLGVASWKLNWADLGQSIVASKTANCWSVGSFRKTILHYDTWLQFQVIAVVRVNQQNLESYSKGKEKLMQAEESWDSSAPLSHLPRFGPSIQNP